MAQLGDSSKNDQSGGSTVSGDLGRPRKHISWAGRGPQLGLVLLFVILIFVFSALKPDVFPTGDTFASILSTSVVAMLLSMGLVFVLIVRDFDLSIAANAALAGSTGVYLMSRYHESTIVAVLACIAVGLIAGVINGVVVAYLNANALITTLATTSVFTGIQEWITNNSTISEGINASYINLTAQVWFGVPASAVVAVLIAVVAAIVLRQTVFGRHSYATGANQTASHLAGVRTRAVRFWSFAIMGLFAGLAGIVVTSLGGSTPQGGSTSTYLLPAYAAAFLGAITIGLGRFTIFAAVIGVLFVNLMQVGLIIVQAPIFTTDLLTGLVLLAAVLVSRASASQITVT